MENKELLTYGTLVFTTILFASSFIAVKMIQKELSIMWLILIRSIIGSILYIPLIFVFSRRRMSKREILELLGLGFVGVTLLFILHYSGIGYTTATIASLIIMFSPAISIVSSSVFLKEDFEKKKIIGVLLAIVGSFILITNGNLNFGSMGNDFIGVSLIILGEFCWVSYIILGKKILSKHSPIAVIGYTQIFGTILLIPIILFLAPFPVFSAISSISWILLFYLAASGVIGAYFYFCALNKFNVSKVAIFEYLIPVFSILMAVFFLNEIITLFTLVGGAAIIFGIHLVQKKW
jgi:drug/metabolite transporter (DMT)-like permease